MSKMMNDQPAYAKHYEALLTEREAAWSRMCVAQKADRADAVMTMVTQGLDDIDIAEQLRMTPRRVQAIRLAITS